jgi:DNA invertase Pin-like site-specific DNA recombinase
MLGIYGAFAEYERDLLKERTNVGLGAAGGPQGGRPALLDSPKIARAMALHATGALSPKEIADAVGVSVATLYRYLARAGA